MHTRLGGRSDTYLFCRPPSRGSSQLTWSAAVASFRSALRTAIFSSARKSFFCKPLVMVLVFPTEIARVSLHNGRLICAGTCFAGLVLHCCNVVGFLIGDFGTGVEGWGLVHNCAVGMSLCSSRDHVEAACSVCKRARDEYFVGHGGAGGSHHKARFCRNGKGSSAACCKLER